MANIHRRVTPLWWLASAVVAAGLAMGQDANPVSQGAILTIDPIKTPRFVTEPIEIHVVVSPTSPDAVDLRELRLTIPESIRGSTAPDTNAHKENSATQSDSNDAWQEGFTTDDRPDDVPDSLAGRHYEYTFRLPPGRIDWKSMFRTSGETNDRYRHISPFFTGKKYKIDFTATVAADVSSGSRVYNPKRSVEIEFLPPPMTLVVGGLVGVVVLALFERLLDLYKQVTRRVWPKKNDGRIDWTRMRRLGVTWLLIRCCTGVVQILLGVCVVVMTLPLIGLNQDRDLPINFKMNGFISAMVVGFGMHLLVAKFYKRFRPSAGDTPS